MLLFFNPYFLLRECFPPYNLQFPSMRNFKYLEENDNLIRDKGFIEVLEFHFSLCRLEPPGYLKSGFLNLSLRSGRGKERIKSHGVPPCWRTSVPGLPCSNIELGFSLVL